jgi:hypothetical protein
MLAGWLALLDGGLSRSLAAWLGYWHFCLAGCLACWLCWLSGWLAGLAGFSCLLGLLRLLDFLASCVI